MTKSLARSREVHDVIPKRNSAELSQIATDFLNSPVPCLGLPVRAINALEGAGLARVADVVQWTARDLRSLPQFGPAALNSVEEILSRFGLSLHRSPPVAQRRGGRRPGDSTKRRGFTRISTTFAAREGRL